MEGIYSEFPAILNSSLLFPSSAPLRSGYDFTKYMQLPAIPGPNFALPLRLKPVKGLELACLFDNKTNSVYDNCLPIFYKSKSILMQKNITGKKVMVRGKIVLLIIDGDISIFLIESLWSRKVLLQIIIGLFVNEIHVLSTQNHFLMIYGDYIALSNK